MAFNKPNKRRLFLKSPDGTIRHIFSFSQHKDGSVYCFWPEFQNTNWISFIETPSGLALQNLDTPPDSNKFSLHGSGLLHFTSGELNNYPGRLKGHQLFNPLKNEVGARHLFTTYMQEPPASNVSTYGSRTSDFLLSCREFRPFINVFFAIPQQPTPVNIQFRPTFHLDYFDGTPPRDIGFNIFSLAYHDILWMVYRTNRLFNWPEKNNIIYSDGYFVPIVLEQKIDPVSNENLILIYQKEPQYSYENNTIRISISISP